jgi:hypothetical protein
MSPQIDHITLIGVAIFATTHKVVPTDIVVPGIIGGPDLDSLPIFGR